VYLHASRATRLLHEGFGFGFGFALGLGLGVGLACSMKTSSASKSTPSSMQSRAAVSCCCCLHARDGGIGVFGPHRGAGHAASATEEPPIGTQAVRASRPHRAAPSKRVGP